MHFINTIDEIHINQPAPSMRLLSGMVLSFAVPFISCKAAPLKGFLQLSDIFDVRQ